MTIDRRTFVVGAALVALAPSLELLPRQSFGHDEEENRIVFLIDGWSIQDDNDTSDQVWLRVGHSWRAAWR